MSSYSATTALPREDLQRATAALRVELRGRLLTDAAVDVPDWDSLVVQAPVRTVDGRGRVWFLYTATVAGRRPVAR
jgi:hypothetical protein